MKKKRMLTLDDLFKFCKAQKVYAFSSKESGYQLCVAVPATFEKKENEDSSLLYVNVKAFHTGLNRNPSNVTFDAENTIIDPTIKSIKEISNNGLSKFLIIFLILTSFIFL